MQKPEENKPNNLSAKERGLEHHKFLETMFKILLPLKQLKETQLEKAYEMTTEDHGFELSLKEKGCLFRFSKKIKQIVDVKDPSQKHDFDLMAIDQNGKLCIVDWKTGNYDLKRNQTINDYLDKNLDVKTGFIVYLDLDQMVELKKEEKVPPTQTEETKVEEMKNKELEAREEQENEIAKLSSILKDKELHSKGLKGDYGSIKYIELLRKLVNDPKNELNKKWIDWFLGKNADICREPCLVNVRDYFRKFKHLYK